MLHRLLRQWPWLFLGCCAAMALYRYGVTRWDLLDLLPQLWIYAKGLGLTLLLLISALGMGFPVLKHLMSLEGRAEVLPFAAALGLGSISLLILLAGVLGGLYPATGIAILGLGILLAAMQGRSWWDWARSVAWRETVGGYPRFSIFYGFLILATVVSVVYALTENGLTPPLYWDESAYHLALPKLYVGAHRVLNVPGIVYSAQPFNTEMLFTLALLLQSEVMASLVSMVFAVVLSAGLWLFALEAFGRRVAFLSVAIFWTVPAVFRLAGTAHVEVPLAAYAFLCVWAFWRWHTQDGQARQWLVLAAAMAGLAAGTKLTGALIALILALVLAFYGWRRRRSVRTIATQMALFGGLAFLLVLPWYVKSYVHTGNPIWPFLNDWFGGRYWDALGDEFHYAFLRAPNLPMTLGSFLTAPWHFTVRPTRFGSFPLGNLVVALALLGAISWSRSGRPVRYLAGVIGLFYVGWFAMTHQTRFLMPVVPCLCILSGHALDRLLARKGKLYRLALQGVLAILILVDMPGITPYLTGAWISHLPYLTGVESRQQLLSRHSDVLAAYLWANEHLPVDVQILLMPYESRGYYLDREYWLAHPFGQRILKLEQFQDGEALWRHLKTMGITHLIENDKVAIQGIHDWPKIEALLKELKTEYAHPIYEVDGVTVCELQP
jgi:4-amino-4-deoxy-L-arabinose transferase-like glycosyltransferase